ncbi:MAG: hypothetical protein WAW17_16915 [Rhodococcus sp. (in: high G+C Gram-positive bacteria)]|uniref:hypothetical protein n=1 Tax=Rhodococcus sp. TaxID=1831 RepID=UPI003BB09C0C
MSVDLAVSADVAVRSFEVLSHELHLLLKTAAEFASRDDTLPSINVVHLEVQNNQLLAVGTDRFVMGVARASVAGPAEQLPEGFLLDVTVTDVKALLPLLKVAKRDESSLTVSVTVGKDALHLLRSDGVAARLVDADVEFPKWRHLMGNARNAQRIGTATGHAVSISPDLLAKFAKAKRAGDFMAIEPNQESAYRPIVIRVGTHFIGILMPTRVPDGSSTHPDSVEVRDAWAGVL